MKIKHSIILTCFIGIIVLFFPLISRGAPVCQGNCVPDGCNRKCPAGCTSTQDPDCGCQLNNKCCGIGCDRISDPDCSDSACINYNQCSTTVSKPAPWYCDSTGTLVENCLVCKCANAWTCSPAGTSCFPCVKDWSCEPWSTCVGGNQIQECTDANTCDTAVNKPKTERPCDSTPPVVTAFTLPLTASSLSVAITSFIATDIVGVTGYRITEMPAPPLANAAGWTGTAPTSYTFPPLTDGLKTLYAWARDAAGNVSASSVDTRRDVTITLPPVDTTAPVVSPFTAAAIQALVTADYTVTDNFALQRVELWRAPYNAVSCGETVKTGCAWSQIEAKDITGVSQSGNFTDSPAIGSYWYGIHAIDQVGNMGREPNPPGPIKVIIAAAIDITSPVVTAFTLPSTASSPVSFTVSAFDAIGVTGYLITDSLTPPLANAAGWIGTAPTPGTFTAVGLEAFLNDGSKILYVWAKDAAGNISDGKRGDVTITTSPVTDVTPPVATSFSAVPNQTSVNINGTVTDSGGSHLFRVLIWRAPDNGGVAGTWVSITNSTQSLTGAENYYAYNYTDDPGVGTWWYKLSVFDHAMNNAEDQSHSKVTIVDLCTPDGCNGVCPAGCNATRDSDCGLTPGACNPTRCPTPTSCSCASSECCVRQCKVPATVCLGDPVGINGTDGDGCAGNCAGALGTDNGAGCALPRIITPTEAQKFYVGETVIFKVKVSAAIAPVLVAKQSTRSYAMAITFKDNGVAPDVTAGDKIYTGQWIVPYAFLLAALAEEPVSSGDYFINLDINISNVSKRNIKIFWPVITNPVVDGDVLSQGNSVVFKVKNAGNVTSNASSDKLKILTTIPPTPAFSSSLYDDASHDDGAANDRLYGGTTWVIPVTTGSKTLELTTSAGASYDPKVSRTFTVSTLTACKIFSGPGFLDSTDDYTKRLNVIYIANDYKTTADMGTFRTDTATFKDKLLSYVPFSDPLQNAKMNFWIVENTVDLECSNCGAHCCGGTCIECNPIKLWEALAQCPFNSDIMSDLVASSSHIAQHYTVGVIDKGFTSAAGTSFVWGCSYDITCHTYFAGWRGSDGPVIAVHEFGHNFGELMDEYDYGGAPSANYKVDWDHDGTMHSNCTYDSNCTYFKSLGINECYPGCNFSPWYRSVQSNTMMMYNNGNFNQISIDHMTSLLNTYY